MIETFLVFFALVTSSDGCCLEHGCPKFYVIDNFWSRGGDSIWPQRFGQLVTSLQCDITEKLIDTVMIFNEIIIYLVSIIQ